MAKKKYDGKTVQSYPRISIKGHPFEGYLDESKLKEHPEKVSRDRLKNIIKDGIRYADTKSRRKMLKINEEMAEDDVKKVYREAGRDLFNYFKKYPLDPASTSITYAGKSCKEVAKKLYINRANHMERMNSGWRYQYIANGMANECKRFKTVSGLGTTGSDFNVEIELKDAPLDSIVMYVSVKNREDTISGSKWPGAIKDLEHRAQTDANRNGAYICIFGNVMQKGERKNKSESPNTEVWNSDFFWRFFTGYSYEEVMEEVKEILKEEGISDDNVIEVPEEVLIRFEELCKNMEIVNNEGNFVDSQNLVKFFCNA